MAKRVLLSTIEMDLHEPSLPQNQNRTPLSKSVKVFQATVQDSLDDRGGIVKQPKPIYA